MPTLSEHRQRIEDLITHNRIEEARDYCRIMRHPDARLWLSEVDRVFPNHFEKGIPHPRDYMLSDSEVDPEYDVYAKPDTVRSDDNPKLKFENVDKPQKPTSGFFQSIGATLVFVSVEFFLYACFDLLPPGFYCYSTILFGIAMYMIYAFPASNAP